MRRNNTTRRKVTLPNVRGAGLGAKAILLPEEAQRSRRAAYQQPLHWPKCEKVMRGFAPGVVCTCAPEEGSHG